MPLEEIIIHQGDWLKITHPSPPDGDGEVVFVRIKSTNAGTSTNPNNTSSSSYSDTIGLDVFNSLGVKHILKWHNCYSFGNGVESNRVADVFNMPKVTPGVKVSTVFEGYKEEHRKYGLIYSGIYNSTSGINNLNQFIQAEKITKDINPVYGSIQKLHARDTDLITLCEDKVLKILANKDAVYNADGNPQLTSNLNVLGQAVPFVGEFGISKNPESYVSEAYRSYFTDKQRGAVMRLSRDGLTPISNHGMKDWFRDNLSNSRVNLLGENNLESEDNWDLPSSANTKIENGIATIGYYNNDIHDFRYGAVARLKMNNVLEIGKKYRLQFDVIEHSGLTHQGWAGAEYGGHQSIVVNNTPSGAEWTSGAYNSSSKFNGGHVNETWTAKRTTFELLQYQVNTPQGLYTPPGGTEDTVQNVINAQRIAAGWPDTNSDGIPDNNGYPPVSWLYGGTVTIKNISVEEVKTEPKVVGSYDDRQDEYNVTIHSTDPKTVSFREDVTGWVSFKSFFPENAISCANDYYTMKNGKLWQHHIAGANNNTFYGEQTNSSLNIVFNEAPGSVKSFHALDYEGSESRVEGIKNITVTSTLPKTGPGVNASWAPEGKYVWDFDINLFSEIIGVIQWGENSGGPNGWKFEGKQYRNNILIYSGSFKAFDNTNGVHLRRDPIALEGDIQVGDIITTEEQEKTVNHFNSMPKDGWYVSSIETDKQKGSLPEFIEKEGKWFNYIKGIDFDIDERTNFGSFDIQGIGFLKQTITAENWQDWIDLDPLYNTDWALRHGWDWINNVMEFDNPINTSLQVGDTIYYEKPSEVLGVDLLQNVTDADWILSGGSGTQWIISSGVFQAGQSGDWGYAKADVPEIIEGSEYELKYTKTTGGAGQFILANHGVHSGVANSDNINLEETLGTHSVRWTQGPSNLGKISLWNDDVFDGTVENISVRKIEFGDSLGFTRLEAENMIKFGIVTDITQNTITVDESVFGNPVDPHHGAFILFVKNQAVNTSSLLGYYADVKIENNSKRKAEMFSISSEITESSK